METTWVQRGDISLEVKVTGHGPLLLCVHGWPELWYSWRHQMAYFAERGYQVAALNVRGYGASSHPVEVASYTLSELSADILAVATALSDDPVILFGHDWGAPQVYTAALRFPDRIRAVAGLSVPFIPPSDGSSLDFWEALYADRFFYQTYFQQTGVVEAELGQDIGGALRKIYYALSGDAPLNEWLKEKPVDARLLDNLVDPDPYPSWMTTADLKVYIEAFKGAGFIGPTNRYRAQALDALQLPELNGQALQPPSIFIGGSRDPVRSFFPGGDLYADPGEHCAQFRGATLIEGAGHWVQQEAPEQTNGALKEFLEGL
jgi:pimeloyl-ACP methyl ester carboxylesterase